MKKQQQRRQPSTRAASKGRTTRKQAAYVDLSDYESASSEDSDSAEDDDARSSEDQVMKAGDAVSVQWPCAAYYDFWSARMQSEILNIIRAVGSARASHR